ncbi:hypothetical protein [Rhodococcus sp. USK13]|uniref:hypothetical protein n=1 Tax=Rhodococcus sp. USK13 TaxID=2806442 RepID=UPI002016F174|nr:hypothetical protein [Rhodococcus sp. USK13]
MRNVDGGYGFGLTFGGVTGIDRAYPEKRLSELFTGEGRAAMHASSAACTVELIASQIYSCTSAGDSPEAEAIKVVARATRP